MPGLSAVRIGRGLSRRALGEAIGEVVIRGQSGPRVRDYQILDWERGRNAPPEWVLPYVARALGVPRRVLVSDPA